MDNLNSQFIQKSWKSHVDLSCANPKLPNSKDFHLVLLFRIMRVAPVRRYGFNLRMQSIVAETAQIAKIDSFSKAPFFTDTNTDMLN